MVGLPPCRISVVKYETKLDEYCPVEKEVCVPLYRKGHERSDVEEPDLEESLANARTDVIDEIIVVGEEEGRSRNA